MLILRLGPGRWLVQPGADVAGRPERRRNKCSATPDSPRTKQHALLARRELGRPAATDPVLICRRLAGQPRHRLWTSSRLATAFCCTLTGKICLRFIYYFFFSLNYTGTARIWRQRCPFASTMTGQWESKICATRVHYNTTGWEDKVQRKGIKLLKSAL